uniref:Sensory transduction regulator n=1 Tax=Panagrellus redivivus TaxID=6233 RepID=A0A7E4V9A1_PANRE
MRAHFVFALVLMSFAYSVHADDPKQPKDEGLIQPKPEVNQALFDIPVERLVLKSYGKFLLLLRVSDTNQLKSYHDYLVRLITKLDARLKKNNPKLKYIETELSELPVEELLLHAFYKQTMALDDYMVEEAVKLQKQMVDFIKNADTALGSSIGAK